MYLISLKIEATGLSESLSSHEHTLRHRTTLFWDAETSKWVIFSWLFEETLCFYIQRSVVREKFEMYTLEDEGTPLLLKVANRLNSQAVSHRRKTDFKATLVWKHHNLYPWHQVPEYRNVILM